MSRAPGGDWGTSWSVVGLGLSAGTNPIAAIGKFNNLALFAYGSAGLNETNYIEGGGGIWLGVLMVVAGFGGKGDTPIVGDWGATGRDEIGVFRDGFWILDYNGNFQWDGTGTGKDIVAGFGKAGDVPVAADLNGDGFPEIAVFRPSAGQLIIDLNGNFRWDGTGQRQDTVVNLGQSGDLEVRGDWDATEIENIGVFRNGFWILDYNGNHQWDGMPEDKAIGFGMFGDTPVSGNYAYAWHP